MTQTLQVDTLSAFTELTKAIQEYASSANPSRAQEQKILALATQIEPSTLQQHLDQVTSYAIVSAATYHVHDGSLTPTDFDQSVVRYDRLRYLLDTQIEQRAMTAMQIKQVQALITNLESNHNDHVQMSKNTAAICTNTIYGDFSNNDLVDALTKNTEPISSRSIALKDIATLTCHNDGGVYRYTLAPLAGMTPELTDVLKSVEQTLTERLSDRSVFDLARSTVESNLNLNRAQESRTESEATSMATSTAILETPETTKQPRRGTKGKTEPSAPAPEAVSNDNNSAVDNKAQVEEQRQIAALEKQSGAPMKASYLRQSGGYDALSPEQKAVCDKDFEAYVEKLTRPLEQREGELKEDALLRAKKEYCASRQEHTARHGQIAQVMLKTKINLQNSDRTTFSLMSPDVAREFLATAFYHNAATSKGITSFDRALFANCKTAAQREFSTFASSVETGKAGTKEFNNTFAIAIERPSIGSKSNNLRIAVTPLEGKREELAAICGKCAFYHSNRSGRTPEEKEQRRAVRTTNQADLGR